MEIGPIELQILRELRQNGRVSYRKLAQKLGLATGTVQGKIEKMLEEGVIKAIRASVNYGKLGYVVTAIIGITSARRSDIPRIETLLSKNKNVYNVYSVTGEYDIMVTARFKKMDDLNQFVKTDLSMDEISRSTTFIVLETTKEEFTLL